MGSYSERVAKLNAHMSPTEIRANKCQRTKQRHTTDRLENIIIQKEREARWQRLKPFEQLQALDLRLGKGVGATKQRKKILAKIDGNG